MCPTSITQDGTECERGIGEPRRILIVHNRYKQAGGEDAVVAAEAHMLRENGYQIELLEENNDQIQGLGKIAAAAAATYSFRSRARVASAIATFNPDLMHCHNLFPLLSTSVYDAAWAARVPVVQTLHNFRVRCANGLLLRDGKVCTRCLTEVFPYSAVQFRCYQSSTLGSAAVAASIACNRLRHTYSTKVSSFIALSEFCRGKLMELGLPAERLEVKPNFLSADPGPGTGARTYFLFVGRISPEKGVDVLIEAWNRNPAQGRVLKIVGVGPDFERLRMLTRSSPSIEWLGRLAQPRVQELMQGAAAVVVPSLWLEAFGLVAVEAFATATPVIASNIGSLSEIVGRPGAGLLVKPGDVGELAGALTRIAGDAATGEAMGKRGREAYEQQYGAAHNYILLRSIYERACRNYSMIR